MASLTSRDFAVAVLKGLGAPTSPAMVDFMQRWEAAEGGAWNNAESFNPLNVAAYDSNPTNPQSVMSSWQSGIDSTIRAINQSNFVGLKAGIVSGDPNQALSALVASPWASSHYGGGANFPASAGNYGMQPIDDRGGPVSVPSGIGGSATFGIPGANDTITAKLDPSCLIGLPSFSSSVGIGPFHIGGPSSPSLCIVSKVMARQLVGGMLIAAGLVGALVALAVIYKKEDAKAAAGTLWQSTRNAAPAAPTMPRKAPTPVTPAQTTAAQKTSAAVLPSKPKLTGGKSVGSKAVSLGELPEELAVLA